MSGVSFLEKLLDGVEVEWKALGSVVETVTAPSKLKGDSYRPTGKLPIIDQGIEFIAGYTDEDVTPVEAGEYVIFGDHSEHIKYVDFPFIQGADGLKILRPISVNAKYIYHAFLNFYTKELNYKRHWSTAQQTLIPIPCPDNPKKSLEIQAEIVRILDSFTKLTAELTAELTARKKQYNYYRDKLLSFEDGEVEWKMLGEVAKIQRGASPRPIAKYITDDEDGVPWIKIGDTSPGSKYVNRTAQKITLEGAEKSRVLNIGDFIMSNSMSFGRPYILGIRGAIHDGWASISDFGEVLNSDYLYHYLSSNAVQNYWAGKINSGSVSNLNADIIKALPVPIPDLVIQDQIASILDKFDALTNSITEGLPREIELRQKQYEYYRDLLLTFPKPEGAGA